jgi:hypoxanthine phosphoribosyltransferase
MQILDKTFEPYISEHQIQLRIAELAKHLDSMNFAEPPLLVGVLNGAVFFATDLALAMKTSVEIAFIKVASYQEINSSGTITEELWLSKSAHGREIILVEDIIDTGLTLQYLLEKLKKEAPKRIITACLLDKPEARKHPLQVDLAGFTIPNKFVVGYGLDYNGMGRNLKDIYKLK